MLNVVIHLGAEIENQSLSDACRIPATDDAKGCVRDGKPGDSQCRPGHQRGVSDANPVVNDPLEEQGLCHAEQRCDNQRAKKDGNDHPIRTRIAKDASDRSPRHSLSGDRSIPCHRLIGLPDRTHAHVGAEPNSAAKRRSCTSRSASHDC